MRFSCERCGKKYAAADPPTPGKIFKLKCKACGHLIVVRAGAGASAPGAQAGAPGVAAPAARPSAADVPAARASAPAAGARNGASAGTSPVPGAAASPPAAAAPPPAAESRPAPGDSGWVDLFSDLAPADEEAAAPAEDPLLAAARSPLPEPRGRTPGTLGTPAAARQRPAGAQASAVIPRPPPQKGGLAIVLIGGGVAVVAGILAFVLLGSGSRSPAAPPQQARAPAQSAPPPVLQPPVPAPPQPEPQPDSPAVERGLSQAQVDSALAAARKRFEACLRDARGTDPRLDGRRVTLHLDVQPSGAVTQPTLDDPGIAATDLGGCLRNAARHVTFPRYEGDALRLDVPIVLR